MAQVHAQLRCAQSAASARGEQLASAATAHTAALEAQAATHTSERTALHKRHAAQQAEMRCALARERERHGETRGLLHSKLEELESAHAEKYDAMRAQQAEWQSSNALAHAKAKRADELERKLSALQATRNSMVSALERERHMRREAELRVIAEQDAEVEAARACAAAVRSNNERAQQERQEAVHLAQQLREQLEVASQLEQVQVASKLKAELECVQQKLVTSNKANATLRQRVATSGLTRAEEEARAAQQRVKELEQQLAQHEQRLEEVEEERELEEVAHDAEAKRARRTHTQQLRRSKQYRAGAREQVQQLRDEVAQTGEQLEALTQQIAAQQVESLRQRHEADVRYNVAMQRLAHGQSHNHALLQQLAASEAAAEEEAKAHALRHHHTLRELKGAKEALEAYMTFQAKEGGRYKESVRMCYYQLINLKVSLP